MSFLLCYVTYKSEKYNNSYFRNNDIYVSKFCGYKKKQYNYDRKYIALFFTHMYKNSGIFLMFLILGRITLK